MPAREEVQCVWKTVKEASRAGDASPRTTHLQVDKVKHLHELEKGDWPVHGQRALERGEDLQERHTVACVAALRRESTGVKATPRRHTTYSIFSLFTTPFNWAARSAVSS